MKNQYKGLHTMGCTVEKCPDSVGENVMPGCINCPLVDFKVIDLDGKKMAARNAPAAKKPKKRKQASEYIKEK